MARIVLLDGNGRRLRLDADGPDACGGYRNVLPGFHELRVSGDAGDWIGAALVVRPDDTAILQLRDGHLEAAPQAVRPGDDGLIDIVARDVARARAWQAATSALDATSVRAELTPPMPPGGLRELQAAFVRAWLHGDADARAPLMRIAQTWTQAETCQAWPVEATRVARALGGMATLFPSLAPELPLEPLVESLCAAGNELADGELLAAASALQLVAVS